VLAGGNSLGGLTGAWHSNDHIQIDVEKVGLVAVDAKLVVGPAPDVLPNVVQHQHKCNKQYEDCHESSRL